MFYLTSTEKIHIGNFILTSSRVVITAATLLSTAAITTSYIFLIRRRGSLHRCQHHSIHNNNNNDNNNKINKNRNARAAFTQLCNLRWRRKPYKSKIQQFLSWISNPIQGYNNINNNNNNNNNNNTIVVLRTAKSQDAELYNNLLLPLQKQLKGKFTLIIETVEEFKDEVIIELRTRECYEEYCHLSSSSSSSLDNFKENHINFEINTPTISSPNTNNNTNNNSIEAGGLSSSLLTSPPPLLAHEHNEGLILCRIPIPDQRIYRDLPASVFRIIAAHVDNRRLFRTYAEELLFYLPYIEDFSLRFNNNNNNNSSSTYSINDSMNSINNNNKQYHPPTGGRSLTSPVIIKPSLSLLSSGVKIGNLSLGKAGVNSSTPLNVDLTGNSYDRDWRPSSVIMGSSNNMSVSSSFSLLHSKEEDEIIKALLGDLIDINATLFSTLLLADFGEVNGIMSGIPTTTATTTISNANVTSSSSTTSAVVVSAGNSTTNNTTTNNNNNNNSNNNNNGGISGQFCTMCNNTNNININNISSNVDQFILETIHEAFFHVVLRTPLARPDTSAAEMLRLFPLQVWCASRHSLRAAAELYVLDVTFAKGDPFICNARVVDEVVAQAVLIHHRGSLLEFIEALEARFNIKYIPVISKLRKLLERRRGNWKGQQQQQQEILELERNIFVSGTGGSSGFNTGMNNNSNNTAINNEKKKLNINILNNNNNNNNNINTINNNTDEYNNYNDDETEDIQDVLQELTHIREFILEHRIKFYNATLTAAGSNQLEEVFGVPATVFPFLSCARESVAFVTYAFDCIISTYGPLNFHNFTNYAHDVFVRDRPEIVRHAPRIFRTLNKTRTGVISFEELCAWMARRLSSGAQLRPDAHLLAIAMSLRLPLALLIDKKSQWGRMECALGSLSDGDVEGY